MLKSISYYLSLLIVFLMPTQLSYHPWPSYSYINGLPIDHLSPAIYFVDLLILIYLSLNIKFILSLLKNHKATLKNKLIILIITFIITNIITAQVPLIALYAWVKTIVTCLFGLVVYLNFKQTSPNTLLKVFFLSIAFFGFLAIVQFYQGSSLGGFWTIFGERPLLLSNSQVAKSIISGELVLRPYSTFPHPNALAGFYLMPLLLTLKTNFKRKYLLSIFILVIILISQSRFVIFVTISSVVIQLLNKTHLSSSLKKIPAKIFAVCVLVIFSVIIFSFSSLTLKESVSLRLDQYGFAKLIFLSSPVFGVGLNNYLPSLGTQAINTLSDLQPVHNALLLLISEIGLLGLSIILVLLFIFKNNLLANKKLSLILLCVFITSQTDHYWITSHQNFLLLVLLPTLCLNPKDN